MYHVPLVAFVTRSVASRRAKLAIGRYRNEDLLFVKELIDAGKYRPVIDRRYALDEIRVSEAAPGQQPEPHHSTQADERTRESTGRAVGRRRRRKRPSRHSPIHQAREEERRAAPLSCETRRDLLLARA
jgi:hypothetical protein